VIASALQALEVFRLRQFDIIAIDWELRSFNALALVRRLRGMSSRSGGARGRTSAPIVAISEKPVELDPGESARLEISRLLVAPLELDELVPELHAVFEEWRTLYPSTPLSDDPLRAKD